MKKINIITGHYGSGKSNFAVNLALEIAKKGEKVTVVDLDIVNPYFRTADFKDIFAQKNVELVSSIYANSNLDIPAISFDVERLATEDGYLIIDVGGDDVGATALGRYTEPFNRFKEDIEMFYVINSYRYMTKKPEEAVELLGEIERCARFKATALVNNSNLGYETDKNVVLDSIDYAKKVAKSLDLPIAYTLAEKRLQCAELDEINAHYINVFVKPIWAE